MFDKTFFSFHLHYAVRGMNKNFKSALVKMKKRKKNFLLFWAVKKNGCASTYPMQIFDAQEMQNTQF